MADNELLLAIGSMMDEKLEPIKQDIHSLKERMTSVEGEISDIKRNMVTKEELQEVKDEISYIKETMVTKDELRQSENLILSELDIVQEKTNEKFSKLQFKVV